MATIEDFSPAERKAEQGGGFSAWLKARSAASLEPEDWVDEAAEERGSVLSERFDDGPGVQAGA